MTSEYKAKDGEVGIIQASTGEFNQSIKKRYLIIAVVMIVIVLIVVAVSLGVVLSLHDSEKLPNRLAKYPVILISADGFRDDYLNRGLSRNISKMGRDGVRAEFLLPMFPTKTFPNHYSIVTGLFPESHGIVFNSFYDPVLRKRFSIPRSRDPAFWGGEPIWMTAKKHGMKTASFFWVGSEIEGLRPTYYRIYNQSVPFSDRVKQVLKWLKLPEEERPSFITLYFHQPDSSGHRYGPDSAGVKRQIKVVDNAIGELLAGLDSMNMTNSINVILLSDHGMSAVNCNDTLYLDKYGVLANKLFISNAGPVVSFNTKRTADREKVLDKIKCKNDSFQGFHKKLLPKRMHFSNNRRIDDIIVLVDSNELVSINSSRPRRGYCARGAHGYDNLASDMRTIFLARGPLFKKGVVVEPFSSLEIYNLLATLLEIKPAPNNGTLGSLNHLLVHEAQINTSLVQVTGDRKNLRTDICQFPNDTTFALRTKCCVCSPCEVSNANVTETDKVFNISSQAAKKYEKLHLPWGIPKGGAGVQGCLMTQPGFIIGYSTHLRIPLWTAHRLNGSRESIKRKDCFRNDVRLMQNQVASCASYSKSGYDRGHLVPAADVNCDLTTLLSSFTFANVVPQHPKFNRGIWRSLEFMIRGWASKYKAVYVISGSIFDEDASGLKDDENARKQRTHDKDENPAIPTHFYKIVTRCDPNKPSDFAIPGCKGSLRVISFILENTNEKCKLRDNRSILVQNVARVKDIELLTGSNFFPDLPRQMQAEIKTFLPVELWP